MINRKPEDLIKKKQKKKNRNWTKDEIELFARVLAD